VYLGDTARVPYGSKSPEVVTQYSLRNARFLAAREIDLLVVACNTASAVALPALRAELGIPVLGVVEPGARVAAQASREQQIVVAERVLAEEGWLAWPVCSLTLGLR
jgi:glutamate racemase